MHLIRQFFRERSLHRELEDNTRDREVVTILFLANKKIISRVQYNIAFRVIRSLLCLLFLLLLLALHGLVQQTGVLDHPVEDALVIVQQRPGGVELGDPPRVQDEDAGAVHDGVEAVGDRQHRAVGELAADGVLWKKDFVYKKKIANWRYFFCSFVVVANASVAGQCSLFLKGFQIFFPMVLFPVSFKF